MNNLNVASPNVVSTALKWYEAINDFFKSFGIVMGGLATSAADWVFGAVTMSVLLSQYAGFQSKWIPWVVGGIFSMALWGIQLILWQIILTGKFRQFTSNKTGGIAIGVIVFIGIILTKFGDDFTDIMGVYWLIRENPMQFVLHVNAYRLLLAVIFFLTWSICGFAEIFTAISINLLKKEGENRPNNQFQNKPNNQPQNKPSNNSNYRNSHPVPKPASTSRPLYQEPTYHPVGLSLEELKNLQNEVSKKPQGSSRREFLERVQQEKKRYNGE